MTDLRKAAAEALEILELMGHRNSDAAQHLLAALAEADDVANITLRDHFAGQALMGMMASRNPNTPRFHPTDDAQYVYAVADAMLKAREANS